MTSQVASFPAPVARMLAVEILLADPESLGVGWAAQRGPVFNW